MRRIALAVVLILSLVLAPLAAEAQQVGKVPRVGYLVLSPLADPPSAERAAFLAGLRELGYVAGQNIILEYRSAAWNRDLLPDLAAELVDLKVNVIVAIPGAVAAARDATQTIPIVVPAFLDPVEEGFVASLARPGGNITGTGTAGSELMGKQLELLKETIPKLSRVAVLWSRSASGLRQLRQTQSAAKLLGVTLQSHEVTGPSDFPQILSTIMRGRPNGLLIVNSPLTSAYRPIIVEFATKQRLPTVFGVKADVEAGGLISYAASIPDMFRRAAPYVDRILKGAKAGDLPIERPTKFELVINLKTAQALGLTIPQSVLVRADEIIQ